MEQDFTSITEELTKVNLLDLEQIKNDIYNYGLDFIKKLIITVLLIVIGRKIIKLLVNFIDKALRKTTIEITVIGFLVAFIRAVLYIVMVAIIIVDIVGIQSGTIIALLGSAGLSIGLALQGGFTNFAGGFLILILKPFRVGDYILTAGHEGTVIAIDIFYTKLLTIDNRLVVMPNGELSNNNIINATNEPNRRLDILLPFSYTQNINQVKDILMNIVQRNEKVLKDKKIDVFVSNFDPSCVQIGLRVWVIKEEYWPLKWELLEEIKNVLDDNKIYLQISQMDVNIKK